MRTMNIVLFLVLLGLSLAGPGCDSDEDLVIPEPIPAVEISFLGEELSVGQRGRLRIYMHNIDENVFAFSLRIGFDSRLVEIDGDTAFRLGEFFGAESISIAKVDGDVVFISVSDISLGEKGANSGVLVDVYLKGINPGLCEFVVDKEMLRFIDQNGVDVILPNLKIIDLSLLVQ